jgi:O-antigen/teichoic acid export membrane protein
MQLPATDNAKWVYAQQIFSRLGIAGKFFLMAALLGPKAVGLAAIAFVIVALAEAASETGLMQAIIQSPTAVDRRALGSAYSLTLARGALVSLILIGSAEWLAKIMGETAAQPMIVLAAVQCAIRSSINPGFTLLARNRSFRPLALTEIAALALDIIVALTLAITGFGAGAILVGGIAADLYRSVVSWWWHRADFAWAWDWDRIRPLVKYGRWIWINSMLVATINQIDKIFVSRWFGGQELGEYQMAVKIAQLVTTDLAIALSIYLFPTISARRRESKSLADNTLKVYMSWMAIYCCLVFLGSLMLIPILDQLPWLNHWRNSMHWIPYALLPSIVGCGLLLMSTYFRAMGIPQYITWATLGQFVALAACAKPLVNSFGVPGIALASATAGLAAIAIFAALLHRLRGYERHGHAD